MRVWITQISYCVNYVPVKNYHSYTFVVSILLNKYLFTCTLKKLSFTITELSTYVELTLIILFDIRGKESTTKSIE